MADTADEIAALAELRGLVRAGRFRLVDHAKKQAAKRGADDLHVRHALENAVECRDQRSDPTTAGDWRVTGSDLDGDELICSVVIENGVVILTVF